jgi:hypothetical protein
MVSAHMAQIGGRQAGCATPGCEPARVQTMPGHRCANQVLVTIPRLCEIVQAAAHFGACRQAVPDIRRRTTQDYCRDALPMNDCESQGEIVEPRASNVIEALRDIGYTLGSAVADLIDNSISAEARQIGIRFGFDDERRPWMAILDDGRGMEPAELVEAMRPGGRDPMAPRPGTDLGRFGLGLKTASFSQCRRTTVLTRRNGVQAVRQWDLDLVRSSNRWLLRTPSADEVAQLPCLAERVLPASVLDPR